MKAHKVNSKPALAAGLRDLQADLLQEKLWSESELSEITAKCDAIKASIAAIRREGK